jgi:hypothetical protein
MVAVNFIGGEPPTSPALYYEDITIIVQNNKLVY